MTFKKFGNIYIAELRKGEQVVEELMRFAREEGVKFAWVSGLGALSKVTMGYYDLEEKEYHFEDREGDLEVTSFEGNISGMEGSPVVHVHLNVADKSLDSFGGHLKEGVIGGTLELRIEVFDEEVVREKDGETGLNLLSL